MQSSEGDKMFSKTVKHSCQNSNEMFPEVSDEQIAIKYGIYKKSGKSNYWIAKG